MYPTIPNLSTGQPSQPGLSQWHVSNRSQTAGGGGLGGGKLSSLLSANLLASPSPNHYGSPTTSAAANQEFVSLLASNKNRMSTARGISIQRTLAQSGRTAKAIAAGERGESGSQTARTITTSERRSRYGSQPLPSPLTFGDELPFVMDARLAAAAEQTKQYRERIITLERQLHVALAANKTQTRGNDSSNSTIDHFPLPPKNNPLGTPKPPPEEKQSVPPATAPIYPIHQQHQPTSRSSRIPPATAAASSSLDQASLHSELSGLHQLLDEYESLFEKQSKEMKALRSENAKLRLQISLTNTLTGLIEKVEIEEQASVAAKTGSQQWEHKESSIGGPSQLYNPTLLAAGLSGLLKQSSSVPGAPTWLVELLQSQANDPPIHTPALGQTQSSLASPARIYARSQALKYVLSTLSPHLNIRDRAVTVLFEEFMKEHSWLGAAFAQQHLLLQALMDHLRKKELGLVSEEDKQIGVEFFKRKEKEEDAQKEADRHATAMVQAHQQQMVMYRGATSPAQSQPQQQQQPQSGLIPGSAGAISRPFTTLLPRTPSIQGSSSTQSSPPPPRNGPVQVDGAGSHNIAYGTEWLSNEDLREHTASHIGPNTRPFQTQPELASITEALQTHQVRFIQGAGMDVPLSAVRLEHAFKRDKANQSKGYSDHPGGIVNVDPNTVVAAPPPPVAQPINLPVLKSPRHGGDSSDEDSDDEAQRDVAAEKRRQENAGKNGQESFHHRDGSVQHVPASVKKWATSVDQLDYITSTEYSSDATSRKPRVRTVKNKKSGKERDRGVSRAYTQTALGALAEPQVENEDEANFEVADPFAPRADLTEGTSVTFLKEQKEAEERLKREIEEREAQAKLLQLAPIHRLGASTALIASGSASSRPNTTSATAGSVASRPTTTPTMYTAAAPAPIGIPTDMNHPPPPPTASFSFALTPHALVQPVIPIPQPMPPPATTPSTALTAPATTGTSSFSIQSEYVPLSSLKLLFELLKFISFKLNHTQQLKHVVHVIRRMVGSDRVTLWFVDHFRQHIWSTIGTAVTNEIRVKVGVGIAGGVAASGKAVTMTNATYDQRFLKKVESGTDYITHACMCVPLKTPRNQTFAVLQIMNKERAVGGPGGGGGGYFTRTDELLAHITCQHLAQNLWGSEMFQLALREKLKTQQVFKHADQLLSCLDVKEMLSSLVGRIRMLMDADYGVLFALSSNHSENEIATLPPVDENGQPIPHDPHAPNSSRPTTQQGGRTRPHSRAGSSVQNTKGKHSTTGSKHAIHPPTHSRIHTQHGHTQWSDAPQEPLREELLTITESCTSQIAIIIPQGYSSDRRGEGFKFNTIRVPLTSGGLAAQSVKNGKVVNIFDTRIDPRFNVMVDEYISDTVGGGGGSAKSQHCTRAFVSIPIVSENGGEPDGVLVLGKLIPKPFQEWEIAELDELRQVLWMGVRRYRADRLVNLRMHDRLSSINRMVSHLDLEAGGTGVILPIGGADEEIMSDALQNGAVIVTEEGGGAGSNAAAMSLIGKMKDPVSGDILPSLIEYQRNRMLFPSAPQLGSTLADAFYKNELTRTADNPHGTLLATLGTEGLLPSQIAAPFISAHSSTMDAPILPPTTENELDESEMRDPKAAILPYTEKSSSTRKSHPISSNSRTVETIPLQRESSELPPPMTGTAAASAMADMDAEVEEDEDEQTKHRNKSRVAASPAASPAQPLKPIDYSKATYIAPIHKRESLLASPIPLSIPTPDAESCVPITVLPTKTDPVEDVNVTLYKPHQTTLYPPPATTSHTAVLDAFHQSTIESVSHHHSTPASSSNTVSVVFNDSAGSGFGLVAGTNVTGQLVSNTTTVSRIALRNMTDYPEVDAMKSVTYGSTGQQ